MQEYNLQGRTASGAPLYKAFDSKLSPESPWMPVDADGWWQFEPEALVFNKLGLLNHLQYQYHIHINIGL